jgi:coatomer subunit zeta
MASSDIDILVPLVHCFVILDSDGNRQVAKYYDGKDAAAQSAFEQMLQKKTRTVPAKQDVEVMLLDNELVVFRSGQDCKMFVTGGVDENELILVSVLDAIFETVAALLRGQVESTLLMEHLELVLLTIDETLDHGHIMELDASSVMSRVLMRSSDAQGQGLGDLSLSQALGMASAQFMKSIATGEGV